MNTRRYVALAFFVAFLMLASAIIIFDPEETEVEAARAPSADAAGYTWIDNRGSDPKVTYDWMDITGVGTPLKSKIRSYSTYRYLYYAITPYEQLGMDFPFYGQTYTQIQVYPNGVLGFADSNYGYAPYNYGGAFPSSYVYTPPGTIAAYWTYFGAPLRSGSTSDIWVYQGVTVEGMKYWAVTWANYNYYGTSSTGSTSQAILYENGDIKVHILESQTYITNYLTMGIQNIDSTIGVNYGYQQRPPDRTAILYKQYATELNETEFSTGFGIDEDIYPAMAGQGDDLYWAETRVWIETDVSDLTNLDYTIGSGSDMENIILRYDFQSETFMKINDGNRMVFLESDLCQASYDPEDITQAMKIRFYYDFNFNWDRIDHVSVKMQVFGTGVTSSKVELDNLFRVETRFKMEGNLTIKDSKDRVLSKGDWVKGGDSITFDGIVRKYADPAIPISPPDSIQIAIGDRPGRIHTGETSELSDVQVYIEPYYQDMEFWFEFINVTENKDMSDPFYKGFRFVLQIDSDKPGLPGELLIKPDSKDDQPQNFDDDPDVYLVWKDAVDQSSGVAMYHISVNVDRDEAIATGAEIIDVPRGTYAAPINQLPEGNNRIFIWAEDAVGNEGNSIFIDVKNDYTPVWFSSFYPITGEWINTLRPRCSILIHDDLTGVNPITIEYEISTAGEVGLVGEWNTISDAYAPGEELRVVVSGWFKNGKDNWIRFRAKDMAGNGYMESEAFNVWVDAKSPTYKLLSHSEDEYQLNPLQEVRIQVNDEQSWVDSSSIEYRISTQGLTKWSQWLPYKDANDGPKPVVSLREHFRRGEDNYIQVRAMDLAGNPMSSSQAFNIKINTYPEIVIISPSSGDRLIQGTTIVFDATNSFDPDGDRLTISWFKSTATGLESLGDSQQVKANLLPGEYTITVIAKDRVNNQVQKTFTITVEPLPEPEPIEDTDLDGMFDWWEIQFQTNPEVKDAQEDPDGDGFTNLQEYENNTNPRNEISKPATYRTDGGSDKLGLFSQDAWPLWALLGILFIAVVLTMFVTKSKKDKQIKRINTVRNMRKIMPSVSWDQITTTAYMAPMTGAPALAAAAGPALPAAAVVPDDQALPPAQEADVAAHEAAHAVQQQEAAPAPEPTPAPAPETPPAPEPAPAPAPMAAPAGTVPMPETPPAVNNLPPQ